MKNSTIVFLVFLLATVLATVAYFWGSHGLAQMPIDAQLNHKFLVAAYTDAWAIQLGYALSLLVKWQKQKRAAERIDRDRR